MTRRQRQSAAAADRRPVSRKKSDYERLCEILKRDGHLVLRPAGQLANLPVRYRWEVTRRHPYYLVAWEEVRRRHRGESATSIDAGHATAVAAELVALIGETALRAIGVAGEPVDPALEFDDPAFGGNDPFMISGACQPLVLRDLALLLMNALPPRDRAAVGAILSASGVREQENPPSDPTAAAYLSERLERLPSNALDSYPLAPFFSLHLDSSQRTIVADVTEQIRLRQRGRVLERATRPEILDSYLKVWDEREGWTGSGYSLRATRRLAEIAGARAGRRQVSTTYDRYCRAFELIVGRSYSFAVWLGLFGFLKLNRYLGDPADRPDPGNPEDAKRYRARLKSTLGRHARVGSPLAAPEPAPAAEDLGGEGPASANVLDDFPAGYDVTDLVADLRDLLGQGLPDAEIAAALGIRDVRFVADVRVRFEEERDLSS